ncbi:MAG: tetratricopeptide repeat protein [Dysgonamonadaceae bacterium]|jgi:tetratricopeptide (TPR) repeat protein|nr:tetratricopeptide repeat protein [Dysgonamonadaceae bacterium]
MKTFVLICICIAGFTAQASAQKQVRKDIRTGNKEYKQEKFTDAEVDYRRALEANARSSDAAYNLGNALYKQGKGQESLEQYQVVTGNETDKSKLSMAWHNTGNVFLASAKDQQGNMNNEALKNSIEAYKKALRIHPKDDETRYNLALAQKLLQDNQDQNQDQDQNQQQQQQQDQQQQQNQNQNQQQEQQQDQQQQNPNEMSRQNADQILDAMMQEEKNTQEKVKAKQMQQQRQRKTEKNW